MNTSDDTLAQYLARVGERKPAPGGGAVTAICGAQACALIEMVSRYSRHERCPGIAARAADNASRLTQLADEDSRAFSRVMQADDAGLHQALLDATTIPAQMIELCAEHTADLEFLLESGAPRLLPDMGIAASLLTAAIHAGELLILANLPALQEAGLWYRARAKEAQKHRERLEAIVDVTVTRIQALLP